MNPASNPKVNLTLPRVEGAGASVAANRNANAVVRGLESAVRGLVAEGGLKGDLHLDRLNVKIPAGASDRRIEETLRRELERSVRIRGGGR